MATKKEFQLKKNNLKTLLEYLVKKIKRGTRVILLEGDLGAGKTFLVQKLVRQYIPEAVVQSPTFVIEKVYTPEKNKVPFTYLHHLDLYRIKYYSEFIDLGLPELMNKKEHLFLFEWPETITEKINHWLKIKIEYYDHGKARKYTIEEK